jgi:hypothetical protein
LVARANGNRGIESEELNAMPTFRRATREQIKLRAALIGPTGAGKSRTALEIAAGFGGRVAAIDTENRSLSRYADLFEFDVVELARFSPSDYIHAINAAESAYDVLVIDSLSHAWMGRDGVLEMVDRSATRNQGNSFAGWRTVTPEHNRLVDAIVRCACHLIVTLRAKTEWVIEKDERGKSFPRKVGLQPVQRDGLEYEFDVVADITHEHQLIVSKTRFDELDGVAILKPDRGFGEQLKRNCEAGVAPTPAPNEKQLAESAEWKAFVAPYAANKARKAGAWAEIQEAAATLGLTPAALRTCTDQAVFDEIRKAVPV